jgi:hypothetical protein
MMPIKNISTAIFLAIIYIFFSSCGNDLSRSKAKDAIIAKYNLPSKETKEIPKSYYVSQYNEGGFLPPVGLWNGENYPKHKNTLDMWQSQGLITLQEMDDRESNGLHWVYKKIDLTEKGKKFLISDEKEKFIVQTCELEFGEVTGIRIQEQAKIAEVEFTLNRVNCSPFTETRYGSHSAYDKSWDYTRDPYKRKISFSLYDDGWRIE